MKGHKAQADEPEAAWPVGQRPAFDGIREGVVSLRDQAYEKIKHLIITCQVKPGEYLNEAYLASIVGIGRTPVHQALDRLRLESLVEVIPRKGMIVKPVSINEVLHIIEARLSNECYAVRLAAERASAQDIAALEEVLKAAKQHVVSRDIAQLMLNDRQFHIILAQSTGKRVLADILRRLHERSLRFWFISLTSPEHHLEVCNEHQSVLDAVRAGDPDAAEKAMREHILSFRHNLSRSI